MGSTPAEQERETREKVVGGNVTGTEEGEILGAYEAAGMPNKSRATRAVLLSFARSEAVRAAVASFLRDNIEILAA